MGEVRLRLFSGFELTSDGAVLTLQPAMQRLVAFVALTPRGVERDYTAYQLWPDASEDRARANLRSTLWRLRKLPADVISTVMARLRLESHVWVDIREGLHDDALGPDSQLAALPFCTAHDDLLPDWYDDWLVVERERLRQYRLGRLEQRARAALDAGDTAAAIQTGLAAVSMDPLRESGRRVVIEAHLAEGNTAEAVREYGRYQASLACDLGLAPSPAFMSLMSSVAGCDLALVGAAHRPK